MANSHGKLLTGVNCEVNSSHSNPLCSINQSCPSHTFQHIPMTWLSSQGMQAYDDDDGDDN